MKDIKEEIHKLIRAAGLSDADAIETLSYVSAHYQRKRDASHRSINDIILETVGGLPK
jgi:hypothetical protein